jgi:hypothetical protein
METLDTLITYLYDLTLGGSALYLGTSLTLFLIKRWNEIEVKPKQSVNIPLALKEQAAIPLELRQEARAMEPVPATPIPVQPLEVPKEIPRKAARKTAREKLKPVFREPLSDPLPEKPQDLKPSTTQEPESTPKSSTKSSTYLPETSEDPPKTTLEPPEDPGLAE